MTTNAMEAPVAQSSGAPSQEEVARAKEKWARITQKVLAKSLKRPPAKARKDGRFLVVMPYSAPQLYFLNETAAALYNAVDGSRTGHDLIVVAKSAFPGVPDSVLQDDITTFIIRMISCRVLRVAR